MAVNGIGNSYSYPAQSNYATETKTQDIKNAGTQAVGKNAGASYEKTISDSTSAGLEFMKQMEKENSGTKFFVGTVSYTEEFIRRFWHKELQRVSYMNTIVDIRLCKLGFWSKNEFCN